MKYLLGLVLVALIGCGEAPKKSSQAIASDENTTDMNDVNTVPMTIVDFSADLDGKHVEFNTSSMTATFTWQVTPLFVDGTDCTTLAMFNVGDASANPMMFTAPATEAPLPVICDAYMNRVFVPQSNGSFTELKTRDAAFYLDSFATIAKSKGFNLKDEIAAIPVHTIQSQEMFGGYCASGEITVNTHVWGLLSGQEQEDTIFRSLGTCLFNLDLPKLSHESGYFLGPNSQYLKDRSSLVDAIFANQQP